MKAPSGDPYAEPAERYCDREAFLGLLARKSGTARKGKTTTPGPDSTSDIPTLTVNGRTDEGTWTASIASEGRPYLLGAHLTDGAAWATAAPSPSSSPGSTSRSR